MKSPNLFTIDFKESQSHNAYLWQKQSEVDVQSEQPQILSVSTMILLPSSCVSTDSTIRRKPSHGHPYKDHPQGKKGFEGNMEWCL